MADEEGKETEEEAEGGNTPWLLIAGAAVIALLAGAGGAYFFLQSQIPDPGEMEEVAAAQAEADEAEVTAKAAEDNAKFQERVFSLEPFVVNIAGDGYNRYLKLKIDLEGENTIVRDELAAHLAQVRDVVIGLLSSKRLSDITDFEGKALLKEDILIRVNDLLVQGEVRSVLFTEFVVQ